MCNERLDVLEYTATIRLDPVGIEVGDGRYIAVTTTLYAGRDAPGRALPWAGYGETPEAALRVLEGHLRHVYRCPCRPRSIRYEVRG